MISPKGFCQITFNLVLQHLAKTEVACSWGRVPDRWTGVTTLTTIWRNLGPTWTKSTILQATSLPTCSCSLKNSHLVHFQMVRMRPDKAAYFEKALKYETAAQASGKDVFLSLPTGEFSLSAGSSEGIWLGRIECDSQNAGPIIFQGCCLFFWVGLPLPTCLTDGDMKYMHQGHVKHLGCQPLNLFTLISI